MVARLGWLLSLGVIAAMPAFGQTPAEKPTHKPQRAKHETRPASQLSITQTMTETIPAQPNRNPAQNQVMAERANLIAQEQTSFTNVVNAYVRVIQAQQLLALNINNEQVLAKQLQATNDRFRVGEIT